MRRPRRARGSDAIELDYRARAGLRRFELTRIRSPVSLRASRAGAAGCEVDEPAGDAQVGGIRAVDQGAVRRAEDVSEQPTRTRTPARRRRRPRWSPRSCRRARVQRGHDDRPHALSTAPRLRATACRCIGTERRRQPRRATPPPSPGRPCVPRQSTTSSASSGTRSSHRGRVVDRERLEAVGPVGPVPRDALGHLGVRLAAEHGDDARAARRAARRAREVLRRGRLARTGTAREHDEAIGPPPPCPTASRSAATSSSVSSRTAPSAQAAELDRAEAHAVQLEHGMPHRREHPAHLPLAPLADRDRSPRSVARRREPTMVTSAGCVGPSSSSMPARKRCASLLGEPTVRPRAR